MLKLKSSLLTNWQVWIINEETGGNFQIRFVPKLPGVYQISAKINEDSLAQSPFTIEVQERKLAVDGGLNLQNETLQNPAGSCSE